MVQRTWRLRMPELQLLEHWARRERGVRETQHRERGPEAGARQGHPKGMWEAPGNAWEAPGNVCQTHGRDMCTHLPETPGTRTGSRWGGGQPVLTRPQAPTCQAWSLMGGQSSCKQGSVSGGWSSKEHAVAWSRDPSSPWQVTLRLRTPAPQLTEHCKDGACQQELVLTQRSPARLTAGGPPAWHGG